MSYVVASFVQLTLLRVLLSGPSGNWEKETENRRMGETLELAPGSSHCFKFKAFNMVDP